MKRVFCVVLCLLLLASAALGEGLRGYAEGRWQYLRLGRWNQAPILWRVLKLDAAGALLLSEQVLAARPLHADKRSFPGYAASDLKKWLNGEFLSGAFTGGEAVLLAPDAEGDLVTIPTSDQLKDASLGFTDNASRFSAPTDSAKKDGVQTYQKGKACAYWTKTPASRQKNAHRRLNENGSIGASPVSAKKIGVRVMITLKGAEIAGGSGTLQDPFTLGAGAAWTEAPAAAQKPTAQPSAPPSKAPEARAALNASFEGFPALTEDGFMPEGQKPFVFEDEENGVWRYCSDTLRMIIRRYQKDKPRQRWFEAEIFANLTKGERLKMYPYSDNEKEFTSLEQIARKNQLPFALNGDFYLYRALRDKEVNYPYPIGIIIRNGKLLYDQPKKTDKMVHPNMDVAALFPDGDIRLFDNRETTGEALLKQGAENTLSFGPLLIRDGVFLEDRAAFHKEYLNPRTGIGMVEKGHYWALMMEGRNKFSGGAGVLWVAETLRDKGCTQAINLDGGNSCGIFFMGRQLNGAGKYGKNANDRLQNEVLGIGFDPSIQGGK